MTNNNLTDERLSVLIRVAMDSLELYEMELPVIDDVILALAELQQRRAAMLQGAEPVTTAYKLPDDFDFDRFNDVVWLEAVASNPHMHSLTTSTIAMVALELNKRVNVENSPVIPDDVRRMDWLVSKTVDVRQPMVYGSHSLFWSQAITDEEDDYHATKLREQIDAAMAAEQAAAPQQEVKP